MTYCKGLITTRYCFTIDGYFLSSPCTWKIVLLLYYKCCFGIWQSVLCSCWKSVFKMQVPVACGSLLARQNVMQFHGNCMLFCCKADSCEQRTQRLMLPSCKWGNVEKFCYINLGFFIDIIQIYSGITSGRVLDGELLGTKILEVNLFAFAYRLFHEDFSPIFIKQSVGNCKQNNF